MRKIYIIPDVHGRSFYDEPLKQAISEPDSEIVFLGDYVDPYPHENITPNDALIRFRTIIDIKKDHPDKITLLIGNHDLHYFDGSKRGCRMDYEHYSEINDMFTGNEGLFDYVKFVTVNGKNFIFSHAGFHFNWIKEYSDKFGLCDESWDDFSDEKCMEGMTFDFLKSFDWKEMSLDKNWLKRYGDVGNSRGGWCSHPSFLWADLSDHLFDYVFVKDCEQIFGHTMQAVGKPVRFRNCYCLDCQNVFVLCEDGIVRTMSGEEIKDNGHEIKDAYMSYWKKASAFFI